MLYGDFVKRALCALALSCIAASSFGEISLGRIYSDNMVLQRDVEIEICGKAEAGAKVELRFAGRNASTKADQKGDWKITLKKFSANKNPQNAVFLENGKPSLEIKNILIGEVWLIAGQSNMEWTVKKSAEYKAIAARVSDEKTRLPIRYFKQQGYTETPQCDAYKKTFWETTNIESVASFSAVGFLFAEKISKELNVPVALIASYVGGSRMAAWIPEEKFEGLEYLEKNLEKFKKEKFKYDYAAALKKWDERVAKNSKEIEEAKKAGKTPPKKLSSWQKPSSTTPWHITNSPSMLYNARIHNLKNFAIRGVLWYQGEADDNGETLDNFAAQLETLIGSWRELFKSPNMPFIYVQLPSMDVVNHRNKKSDWARVRWEQQKVWNKLGNVGMAVVPDTGEINDVHPPIKTEVAERLANIALKSAYGKKIPAIAPRFTNAKLAKGGTVEIDIVSDSKKIIGDGSPRGFEIKIDDNWLACDAKIQGKKVVLSRLKDEENKTLEGEIEAVRYLWKSWAKPDCWLKTQEGLPASTFFQQLNK